MRARSRSVGLGHLCPIGGLISIFGRLPKKCDLRNSFSHLLHTSSYLRHSQDAPGDSACNVLRRYKCIDRDG
jgi:hypothetical protein